MAPPLWGVLAGLTGLAAYVPYLRDAWRRASDPDPAAWLIWTIQYGILLASQIALHPPWSALILAALQLAGTLLVFGVLAARGRWRFSRGRWAVLGGAAVVMTVWWFTRAPGPAMCLALAVEGAGMALVMLNAYRRPGSETILTWWVFIAAGLFDLPALWLHTPRMLYAYPVFFIVMGAGVLIATAFGARARLAGLLRAVEATAARRAAAAARGMRMAPAAHPFRPVHPFRPAHPRAPAHPREPAHPMAAALGMRAAWAVPAPAPAGGYPVTGLGTMPASGYAALRLAQRQGYLPGDRQRSRLPVQAARQPRAGKRAEELGQCAG